MNTQVSIDQIRESISELVKRVARSGERVLLTLNGKPIAALVRMQDYERLLKRKGHNTDIQKWLAETRVLSGKIEKRRGKPVDVDAILEASRHDLEMG
jgi:prevent-host-death family protein